jgi:hypothetical protein
MVEMGMRGEENSDLLGLVAEGTHVLEDAANGFTRHRRMLHSSSTARTLPQAFLAGITMMQWQATGNAARQRASAAST